MKNLQPFGHCFSWRLHFCPVWSGFFFTVFSSTLVFFRILAAIWQHFKQEFAVLFRMDFVFLAEKSVNTKEREKSVAVGL